MNKLLVLATRNKGKIEEMKAMLSGYGIEVKGVGDFPECSEIEEDGDTFQQNAIKKAETISKQLGVPALADDSGLEVDVLEGRPGVYSARFAGPDATDEENIEKLIESLRDVPAGDRQARFRCVVAVAVPGKDTWTSEGTCEGHIVLEPTGNGGFGYDPIFYVPEKGKTMAQLTKDEKNQISHRGKAMRQFLQEVATLL